MEPLTKQPRPLAKVMLFRLFCFFGVLARTIKRKHSDRMAWWLGDFVFDRIKLRRALVEENLTLSLPGKSPDEISSIARQIYRSQAVNLLEVLRLPLIRTRADAEALLDIDAVDFVSKVVKQKKGAVLVSAHYGNWELLAFCFGTMVAPLNIVVKPLKNELVDKLINRWRSKLGNRVIYDYNALREGLRVLQEGGIMSLLGDQSDPGEGFFMDFLGRQAPVFLGPAYLALKAGVPLFIGVCYRTGSGRYKVEAVEIPTSDLENKKDDIKELTRRYTKVLEEYIYRYPQEWFWLHNRWKRGDVVDNSH
jgi:KDO2-lipid IV(A) lauroyltransferase